MVLNIGGLCCSNRKGGLNPRKKGSSDPAMWISNNDGSELTINLFVEVLNQQNAMVTLNKWGLQPTNQGVRSRLGRHGRQDLVELNPLLR